MSQRTILHTQQNIHPYGGIIVMSSPPIMVSLHNL